MTVQTAEPRQAPHAIADALIAEIRSGRIAPDAALPTERDLCARFDASRPTVREALSLMQHRGYLSGGGGKRPRAARPSLPAVLKGAGDLIRDILGDDESGAHLEQMRQFIETGAARTAATAGRQPARSPSSAIRARGQNFRRDQNGRLSGRPTSRSTAPLVAVVGNPVILTLHDLFVSDDDRAAARPNPITRIATTGIAYGEHRADLRGGDRGRRAAGHRRHGPPSDARSWRQRLGLAAPRDYGIPTTNPTGETP